MNLRLSTFQSLHLPSVRCFLYQDFQPQYESRHIAARPILLNIRDNGNLLLKTFQWLPVTPNKSKVLSLASKPHLVYPLITFLVSHLKSYYSPLYSLQSTPGCPPLRNSPKILCFCWRNFDLTFPLPGVLFLLKAQLQVSFWFLFKLIFLIKAFPGTLKYILLCIIFFMKFINISLFIIYFFLFNDNMSY